jgi:hypothetical protein
MNVVYGSGRLCCKCIDFCIIRIDLAANSKQLRKWQWHCTPWVWLPDWLLRWVVCFLRTDVHSGGLENWILKYPNQCNRSDIRKVISSIQFRTFYNCTLFKACRPKLDRCKVIMTVLVIVCVDGIWLLLYDVWEQRGEYMGIGLGWLNWASRLLYYTNWIILSWGWHTNDK